jgi:DNA-directed RNA polymerase specialized sigma24 family protein
MRGAVASTSAQDEGSLVVAARSDSSAFGELYDRYVDPVYRFCLRRRSRSSTS